VRKLIRRVLILLILEIQLLTLAGCWDSQDIEEMSIPIVGGYDLVDPVKDKDVITDGLVVTGVFPNLSPETDNKVRVEPIIGLTTGMTRYTRDLGSPEIFVPGMLQVGIFGEDLAKKDVNKIIDNLFRTAKIKNTLYLAVAEGRADELLKMPVKDYQNIGIYLLGLLRHAQQRSYMPSVTLHEFGVNSILPGRNPILPIIKTEGSEITFTGIGVFRKSELITKLDLKDARSLFLLRREKGQGRIPFIVIKNEKQVDTGTVEVTNSGKVRVEPVGDDFIFDIKIKLTGTLIEHENEESLQKQPERLQDIEQTVAADIEQDCRDFIKKMQEELKVDCIDINKYALAKWRNELEDQIDNDFIEKVKINVEVEVHLKNTGELT